MRKLGLATLFLASLYVSYGTICFSQTINLSPQIQDSDTQTWNSGTYKIVLLQSQPGTPYRSDTGAGFTTSFSGTMNSSGVLSVTLTDTNFIVPANSQWTFTLCPLATGAPCGSTTIPVTSGNASQIQTLLNAAIQAPRITGGPFTQAYNDTEVAQLPNNSYYSLTALQNRCYSNTWGACTSSASAGVSSLNTLTGALTLAAGSNITITPSGGNTLTVASTGGSNPGGTTGQVQWNNGGVLAGFTMVGDATLNTSTGSLTLASVNSAIGTCGDSTHIPQVTLNAKGLTTACTPIAILSGPSFGTITSGTNTTASMVVGSGATLGVTGSGTIAATSLTPDPFTQGSITFGFAAGTISATTFSGAFSGDCSSCTNLNMSNAASGTLAIVRGGTGNGTAPSSGQIEIAQSGTAYNPKTMSGDATLAATGALTLATVNSNVGVCGDATHVSQVTLNAKGLTTACTAVAITALTNPMTTLGDIIYGGASGAATRLAGPTAGTVPYTLTSTPSGGLATAPAWGLPGVPGRTVTTTTDTVAATDRSNVIGFNSASAVAETFTSPATLGNNFSVGLHNLAAGAVTATLGAGNFATTGTSTKVLANGEWCAMSSSDNANVDDRCSSGLITAGTNVAITHSATGESIAVASAAPSGSASGDLSGSYPGPTVNQIEGAAIPTSAALVATNSSKQLTAVTVGTGVVTALGVNTGSAGAFGVLIASGTAAMGTSAISSGTCATVVTVAATGVATTDTIQATPNADPTGVTGYAVSATGSLYIQAYPTSGNVNFKVCNNTSGSLTPSALTLNWRVVR